MKSQFSLFVWLVGVGADERVNRGWCPLHAVFADVHDGDRKMVNISHSAVKITPADAGQSWEVDTEIECSTGEATVDFNVPGKDDHPPVPLLATRWLTTSFHGSKTVFEFTDPSGTLDDPTKPLNHWVQLGQLSQRGRLACPRRFHGVFADMADGDQKEVTIHGRSMTIKPSGNEEVWTVNAVLDHRCEAVIDFNVAGKPNPPPVNLTARFWEATRMKTREREQKILFEFTDPTGTLGEDAKYPLNHWVELPADTAMVV